ncbi:MAG: hypothetical protein QMD03_09795 [Syntrophales bacterium]|nr:hypothetical protein [Syntrophales bacterium]
MLLGVGIAGAGTFANTSLDKDIQERYTTHVKNSTTDDLSKILRQPGEVFLTVPALFGSYIFFKETSVGEWSQRSIRALAVGGPSALFLRGATGGLAPGEGDSNWEPFNDNHQKRAAKAAANETGDSNWEPFSDNHGVSAHSFIGAVPFITAAQMNDNPYLKSSFYTMSALPALSRINDNAHYFSQAALGWYLSFLSCRAVEKSQDKRKEEFSVYLVPFSNNGLAIMGTRSF